MRDGARARPALGRALAGWGRGLLHRSRRRGLRNFLRGPACRKFRELLGCQVLRLRVDDFGRGAVKGDALQRTARQ
jgi:hypothetical protein